MWRAAGMLHVWLQNKCKQVTPNLSKCEKNKNVKSCKPCGPLLPEVILVSVA